MILVLSRRPDQTRTRCAFGPTLSSGAAQAARLAHIKGLTNLHELGLVGTKVTAAGVAELQQALPNCTIEK